MFNEWLKRFRFLTHRGTRFEVDEELQFHLERQIEANIAAGMPPEEARRQALIAFGGVERAREECREQRPGYWLETLLQDVRYALRGFRHNPVFAITVILTLALGIGATTAVFSVVDRILFRSLPYAHDDRLVSLGVSQPLEQQEFTLGGFFFEWQRNQKPFSSMTFEHGVDACNLTEANPVHLICAKCGSELSSNPGDNACPRTQFLAGRRCAQRAEGGAHQRWPLAESL